MICFIKEVFDRAFALLLTIVMLPLFSAVGFVVFIQMGSPVFFCQARPGKGSNIFKFYKFRTMSSAVDIDGNLLPDAFRLTGVGKFLRKTSLDELPQLVNVLKGDMSFVGPRPLLVEYLDLYTSEQSRRHTVKPGITGWAQIKGRNSLAWEDKFQLDLWYIDNWSLFLDLKILCLTVIKVLKRDGIAHDNHATMDKFKGSSSSLK